MKSINTKKLVYTSLCIAIGLVLPQFIMSIPIPNLGSILLPMHITVLICGFLSGSSYGAICGAVLPLLASALTGKPPIFPTGLSMMFELASYGMITGLLYKYTKGKIFVSLIGAMIGGRIVMGIANTILYSFTDKAYGMSAFISRAIITALPGIIIQLILIPSIIYALKKSNFAFEQ